MDWAWAIAVILTIIAIVIQIISVVSASLVSASYFSDLNALALDNYSKRVI
jgi:hypothetical protein